MIDDEDERMRAAALKNIPTILRARQQAEQQLVAMKEALEEETRILELINRTGAKLASRLDVEGVVQAVTDAGTELSGAQFGAFFYTVNDADGGKFMLFTLAGAPREAFEKFGHPRATPLFAPTFRGEGVIRIADVLADPRYGKMDPHHGMPAGHLPVRSYLAAPVLARTGEVLGGLFFGHANPNVFSERAERLVVALAAQASIALDNARLYEDAKRAADERASLLAAERAARAELERVSMVKDEFLATLSHELRTPLNAVLGWADVLLRRTIDDGSVRKGLDAIARNARAQAQLIDDLLDMNRIVSGKIRLDVQRIELAPTIEAAIDSVRPSADAKEIVIRAMLDAHAGGVFGDPHRLHQVVWNLLTNAVKFTPKRGKIDVLLQRVNSHVEITVHDTGMGVPPEFLPHLFERFRQQDATTTRTHGGLGLGLSIVRQLVELHGGTVTAHSEGAGKGATFVVCLPLRAVRDTPTHEHPTTMKHAAARPPEISLSGIKVLVVDDEPDARELVAALLADCGAQVFTVGSAAAGLELVQSQLPNLIVSDIGMPERDGYDFIRDVRALSAARGGKTPAIAITAFARSQDRTRAMLAGFQAHVAKPIEPQELIATVKALGGSE